MHHMSLQSPEAWDSAECTRQGGLASARADTYDIKSHFRCALELWAIREHTPCELADFFSTRRNEEFQRRPV